jgi:phospholipase/carboxylesterase
MNNAAVDLRTGKNPTHAVIWLHGLGADGHDFEPIVPELIRPHWPAIRFVFPHAPVRPVTINGGMPMRAWYDIRGMDIASRADEAGIRESIGLTHRWLDHLVQSGIPAHHILLAGFSQGGAVILNAMLRYRERLAGAIALSTYLPLHDKLAAEAHAANAGTPIFMAHGSADPIVPLALGRQSADVLVAAGYPLTWRQYQMQHSVCAEEVADIAAFIESRYTA